MRRIRVLFFYPNEFLGPEMTVFTQIIKHLDRSRFEVYVVLNADATGDADLTEGNGVHIVRWKFGSSLRGGTLSALISGLRLPGSMLKLVRYARRHRIDIVQCSAVPRTGTLGLVLARLTGARLLLHYHVIAGRYGGARGLLESMVARSADRAVTVSKFLAKQVPSKGIPAEKVDVVVNGTDCVRFHPNVDGSAMRREYGIADDEVLVLQLARIIQQKRQEDVVRAFAIAHKEVPNLRGLLVGWEDPRYDGPYASYKAELEHIIEEEALGDSIRVVDARPEAPQLVAASDIVVMPTIEDSWNLAVTEAMAGGKPVIGSNSGGIPEQIVEGSTGYLVPVREPAVLAERLIALGKGAALRERMGKAGRSRAETYFAEPHLAADFAPIYEHLARGYKPAARPVTARPRAGGVKRET